MLTAFSSSYLMMQKFSIPSNDHWEKKIVLEQQSTEEWDRGA